MNLVAGYTANSSFAFLNFLEFSPQIFSIYVWLKLQLQCPQILKTGCVALATYTVNVPQETW